MHERETVMQSGENLAVLVVCVCVCVRCNFVHTYSVPSEQNTFLSSIIWHDARWPTAVCVLTYWTSTGE